MKQYTAQDYNQYVRDEIDPNRPPIFDERNRHVWEAVRRLMLVLLKEMDRWYGWDTFKKS